MKTQGLVIPIINLNGTAGKDLLQQVRTAYHAIVAAKGALAQAAPHGRDYQMSPAGSYERARSQFDARIRALHVIEFELEEIATGIMDQMIERGEMV